MSKRSDSGICSYHLCEKKTYVRRCWCCGEFFCKEHIRPKPPGPPRFDKVSHEDRLFMEEWSKKGHPCPNYMEHWKRKKEWERDRYLNALDKLKKSKAKHYESDYDYSEGIPIPKSRLKEYGFRIRINKKLVWTTIILLLLIGLVWYFNRNPESLQSIKEKIIGFFNTSEVEKIKTDVSDFLEIAPTNTTEVELKIHDYVNQQRISNGLPALKFDTKLSEIARSHSQDMAKNGFFSHTNLKGQDPTQRGNLLGYSCYKDYGLHYTEGIAENIYMTPKGNVIGCGNVYSENEIANCVVIGWMSSPGHRKNILTSTYDKEGIGVAISSDGKVYATENFC